MLGGRRVGHEPRELRETEDRKTGGFLENLENSFGNGRAKDVLAS